MLWASLRISRSRSAGNSLLLFNKRTSSRYKTTTTTTTTTISNGAKAKEIMQTTTKRSLSTTTTTTTTTVKKNEGKNSNHDDDNNMDGLFVFKQQMNATTRQLLADLLPNDDNDDDHDDDDDDNDDDHPNSIKMRQQDDDNDDDDDDDDGNEQQAAAAAAVAAMQRQRRRKSRLALARAITLVESTAPHKKQQANLLLQYLLKYHTAAKQDDCIKSSFRVGITGAAGAGKSSLIEALGMHVLSLLKQQKPNSSNNNKMTTKAKASSSSKDACGQENSTGGENDNDDNDDDDDDVWYPNQLAVLCIDPSSHVSGGSILGDKTRMTGLSSYHYHTSSTSSSSVDSAMNSIMHIGDRAFVRPSPSGATAAMTAGDAGGGIAGPATNDVVSILCPAAGYDWVLLETVGIGQSQTIISESVDLVVLLVPPGGGDGLQAVKKGNVEVADIIAVTKADGDLKVAARKTANDYKNAAHFLSPRRKQRRQFSRPDDEEVGIFSSQQAASSSTTTTTTTTSTTIAVIADTPPPPVLMVSATTGEGLDKLWKTISRFRKERMESGELEQQRRHQRQYWMWTNLRHLIQEQVVAANNQSDEQKQLTRQLQDELNRGETPPRVAAVRLLASLLDHHHGNNNNSNHNIAHDERGK